MITFCEVRGNHHFAGNRYHGRRGSLLSLAVGWALAAIIPSAYGDATLTLTALTPEQPAGGYAPGSTVEFQVAISTDAASAIPIRLVAVAFHDMSPELPFAGDFTWIWSSNPLAESIYEQSPDFPMYTITYPLTTENLTFMLQVPAGGSLILGTGSVVLPTTGDAFYFYVDALNADSTDPGMGDTARLDFGFTNPTTWAANGYGADLITAEPLVLRIGDCNGNGVSDTDDIASGTSKDCNENGVPDECEQDCNGNGVHDDCDISTGVSMDCNENRVPDECDLDAGTSADCQDNDIPDECDITSGLSEDCNRDGVPDECQAGTLGCCPRGVVQWLDPPDGVVDAGYPIDPRTGGPLGIYGVDVKAPSRARVCWSLCETETSGEPNRIAGVDETRGTYTLVFERPITPGACTTLTYTDNDGLTSTMRLIAHPGNVDANTTAAPSDILSIINIVNGAAEPVFGDYSADVDRSGAITPSDSLAVVNLLNGVIGARVWKNTRRPDCTACIPCPPGEVVWLDPPQDVVDAGYPFDRDTGAPLGIDSIIVRAPTGAAHCWSLCETEDGGEPNRIVSIEDNHDSCTIRLARSITPGACTVLSYTDDHGVVSATRLIAHPGNVDGSERAAPADILAMVDIVNAAGEARFGAYSADIDRSGRVTPSDVLAVIDLLNGAGRFDPWLNTIKPDCTPCAP